jgi:selenocysteine lyase/cysteine desulfurase
MACAFMDGIGMDRVRERGLELAHRLESGLSAIDGIEILTPPETGLRGSILTFRTDLMPFRDLYQRLSRDHHLRIRIVTEVDLNAIRISLHVFNNEEEVDRVIEGVRSVLG